MAAGSMRSSERAVLPDAAALNEARARLGGTCRRTPLEWSSWLSERVGEPVFLKLECWQVTRSFKLRGAFNAIAALAPETRARGLVTASAGNHGLAVAHAARLHEARATIFVPAGAPETKKARIRGSGADLREVDGSYDDAAAAARAFARDEGAHLVHAFNDPDVVAGQGTVGLEILEELPDVGAVVVPVGGGGLAAGVGAAFLAHGSDGRRSVRVLGAQSTATRSMYDAFEAGRVVSAEFPATLCDGLAGETEPAAYERARAALDDLRLVDEARVAPSIRALFDNEGIVAEGAGAVGVAALLEGTFPVRAPVVVVVSGGNIDGERLARILTEV